VKALDMNLDKNVDNEDMNFPYAGKERRPEQPFLGKSPKWETVRLFRPCRMSELTVMNS